MKGFKTFAKGIGGAVLRSGDGSAESAVEVLLQRIGDGVLAEDRQEALADLRDLISNSAQAKVAVGALGLPMLCTVVKEERQDIEMLRGALECLTIVIGPPSQAESAGKGPHPAAINAELFSRGKDNVEMLLGLLEDEPAGISDFYVRYHTIQLLTSLAAVSSFRIQEAILAAPMGVVHLMDMMMDMEALRNEVLLLLIGLTHSNQSIQQIAAFEGAFERLLNIVSGEGAADGGIVVQDCLEMMNNLLRGNAKNQLLFREMGHLPRLPGLLRTQANIQKPLARQKVANLLAALDSIYLLLASITTPAGHQSMDSMPQQQPDKAGTQITLLKAGCLEALLKLVGASSVVLRSQALRCIWQLVEGNHTCQQHLLEASAPSFQGIATSALQVVLRIVLHGRDMRERFGALKVLQAFCIANKEGQQALTSTITASVSKLQPTGQDTSFGTELMHSLVDITAGALQASGRAARVLSYLLADNDQSKEMLLPYLADTDSTPGLLSQVLQVMSEAVSGAAGEGSYTQTALLFVLLMITVLAGAPPIIKNSMCTAALLMELVSCVNNREQMQEPMLAGLAAVMLGACLSGQSQAGQDAKIIDTIKTQIGVGQYLAAIQMLKQTPEFVAGVNGLQVPRHVPQLYSSLGDEAGEANEYGAQPPESPSHPLDENPFDQQSTQLILIVEQQTRQQVLGKQAGSIENGTTLSSQAADIANVKLQQAETLIQHLQRELHELKVSSKAGASNDKDSPAGNALHDGGTDTAVQLAAAQDACSVAKDQAASLQKTVQQLTDEKSALQTALTAAKLTEQEAVSSAQRFEAELSDLAGAYNNLEVHSYQLEAQIKRLQNQASRAPSTAGSSAEETPQASSPHHEPENGDAEESAMSDLLTCLGLEEQKTHMFQAKLEELGVDVQPLLDSLEES
ncbi:hypothetical protein WJX77_011077 [Trebouxia sp. C0004]